MAAKLRTYGIPISNEGNKAYDTCLGIIAFSAVKQEASVQMRTILWVVKLGKIDVGNEGGSHTVKLGTSDKDLLWDTTIQDGFGYWWDTPVTKHSFRTKSRMKRSGYEEV